MYSYINTYIYFIYVMKPNFGNLTQIETIFKINIFEKIKFQFSNSSIEKG